MNKDLRLGIGVLAGATALVVGFGLADGASTTVSVSRAARQMPRSVVSEKDREGAERTATWPFDREALLEARREREREAERERGESPGEPESEILNGPSSQQVDARAYPRGYVSTRRATAARRAYAALPEQLRPSDFRRGGQEAARQAALAGSWTALGPVDGHVPGEVTYTGTPTTTSGRVTALAIAPTCTVGDCRLWVAAAGGGIWRTDDALAAEPTWTPLDEGLTSNTFGSLALDPNDPTGNTVYAGSGEPSGSSDSEAGVGLFKSTNGGDTWNLVPGSPAVSAGNSIAAILVDPTDPNTIRIGTSLARHGSSSVNGGRRTPPDAKTMGIYKSTDGGASFSLEFSQPGDGVPPATGQDYFIGGVRRLVSDPADPSEIYAAIQGYGIYRMGNPLDTDPTTFNQIYRGTAAVDNFASIPEDPYGAMIDFDLADVSGATRIYVGDTSDEYGFAFLATADGIDSTSNTDLLDAEQNDTAPWDVKSSDDITDPAGFSSNYWCQYGQCSYDSFVKVDPSDPNTVWMGGAMNYDELYVFGGPPQSNGRAVIRSTDGGNSFTDMTADAAAQMNGMHPDQRALVFNPSDPSQVFIGSDGGVVRTDGIYVTGNGDCGTREDVNGVALDADQKAFCNSVLAEVPRRIDSLNKGLNTLQFQSLSASSTQPYSDVIGGTQDNGTWAWDGAGNWFESVGGDGGQSGISTTGSRMHTYYGTSGDVNFRGNDPTGWNYVTGPIDNSGENSSFYVPLITDPAVPGTYFMGAESVWRTTNSGGDQAQLESQCNEFTGTGPWSTCGDWVTVGPSLAPSPSDYIVAVSRTPSDANTMWVGLREGELFVSKNVNDQRTSVAFEQVSTPQTPGRFVSGIAIDPRDPNHAWISYSGYGAYTPGQPGHVFEATYDPQTRTATFNDRSLDLGDMPVTGIALDSPSGDLYVSTDFGVARLAKGATSWVKAAQGLPPVATYGLTIDPTARVLYAATHGRGAYTLALDPTAVIDGPTTAVVGERITLSSEASSGFKGVAGVRWTLPDGNTSTQPTVDWTPVTAGSEQISLEVTDSLGHTATTTQTVTVTDALIPQFGKITHNADGFTVVLANYNPDFTWAATSTAGTAKITSDGTLVVTGLKPGQKASVTVTTDRSGYPQGSAVVEGSAAKPCPLTVKAKKKSYRLPASGSVKVVKKATSGKCVVKAAKVKIRPQASISKVKIKKLSKGALKVTTKGKPARVTATYRTTPRSDAYLPSSWKRSWRTKK